VPFALNSTLYVLNRILTVKNATGLAHVALLFPHELIARRTAPATIFQGTNCYPFGLGHCIFSTASLSEPSSQDTEGILWARERQTSEVQSPRNGFVQPGNADNAQ